MLSANVVKRLIALVKKHEASVSAPIPDVWRTKSDGELWARVLGQIAVVGSAASGQALSRAIPNKDEWYKKLVGLSDRRLTTAINRKLLEAGVRYASDDKEECRKTAAAVYNFQIINSYGGPFRFFENVASIPLEVWRVAVVRDELAYIKNKGARDLLIGLGLITQAIAFDTRIMNILNHCGADIPEDLASNKIKYKALENELLEKVCKPCGISGAHFDRIMFQSYAQIIV
ncbi:hypothetical protein [Methylocaldum sp.]|uniref:hypothetical protein n=1 Tax=Methylocaldum sp. TaxID=1969727 RepID=UPI002D2D6845|nr:hypothetical protein [Methylocaldum sp.]HYE34193.1 hypothetical protein [Methylocaldum sp.]